MNINKLVKAVEEKTGEEIILITGYKETQYKGYKIHEANVVVPKYAKYNLGRIKSLDRMRGNGVSSYFMKGRIMRQSKDPDGYLLCGLRRPGYYYKAKVHREVAKNFIPNPDNLPEVNHIGLYENGKEGNKEDNRYFSLKWSTGLGNMQHAAEHGLMPRGEAHVASKLTEKEVREIKSSPLTQKELSMIYNVKPNTISRIISGKRWGHIK